MGKPHHDVVAAGGLHRRWTGRGHAPAVCFASSADVGRLLMPVKFAHLLLDRRGVHRLATSIDLGCLSGYRSIGTYELIKCNHGK